jgi:hypothetical protein
MNNSVQTHGGETMKRVTCQFVLIFSAALLVFNAGVLYAAGANVLPKGVSNIELHYKYFSNTDTRFDSDGDREDVDSDFDGVTLDGSVFPPLGPLNLGTTGIDFDYDHYETIIRYQYGLSDKMTIGIMIPFYDQSTNVNTLTLDTASATAGIDTGTGLPAPMGPPNVRYATIDDIQAMLTAPVFGYEYERIESWSGNGLSDIEAGLRYQYLTSDDWDLAFTGGIRFPTGEVDDPDNLLDQEFGTGAYALMFYFNHDYKAVENLVLNATVGYEIVLPSDETLRVPADANLPLAPAAYKEKVDRDIGDLLDLELSGNYSLSDEFSVGLLYNYSTKGKDDVSGDQGLAYESLENETDKTSQQYILAVSYSTVKRFMETQSGVPFVATLEYRDRFAGSNKLDTDYIGLKMALFF